MAGTIDNDVYERLGKSWWDETSLLYALHGLTPGRFAYFRDVLAREVPSGVAGLRAVDIGCGGGFLAEQFAALGCQVTGIDPSPVSIDAARAHALSQELRIDYLVGAGEDLPVPELTAALNRHGLSLGEITGLGPRANPVALLRNQIRARRGHITYGELARRMNFGRVRSTANSYMGFAAKAAAAGAP